MKMMYRLILQPLTFLIGFVALISGCGPGHTGKFNQGKIVYDVEIETEDMPAMMKAMLPSEITTYFSENKTCTVIRAGMNAMETRLISDANDFEYRSMVNALGKKMAMVLNRQEVKEYYSDRVPLKVVYTGEHSEIAGIACKKAIITDSTSHTYPVYYTEALPLESINWCSPFNEIKGMLMEYSVSFGNMIMKLKARSVEAEEVDPAMFTIPEGYVMVEDPSKFPIKF